MLAGCRCDFITEYHASVVLPASSQLLIVMELMSATAADLVGPFHRQDLGHGRAVEVRSWQDRAH